MKTFDLRAAAAVLAVGLALASCSRSGQSGAENTTAAPAEATAPAPDAGRGAMLNARIDAATAAVAQAQTSGALTQADADRLNGELVAIRGDLSAALSSDPGPIPVDRRQALADRIAKVEAELAAKPTKAQP